MVIPLQRPEPAEGICEGRLQYPERSRLHGKGGQDTQGPKTHQEKPDAIDIKTFEDKIEFKDVCFSYQDGKQVLKHINITIPKGKTIALVGQSGSGKSTLVDLVPRYHDVSSGEVIIDGHNIKDLKINGLRGLIGNVNQEAILFNDTIFNNIAFGVEGATWSR